MQICPIFAGPLTVTVHINVRIYTCTALAVLKKHYHLLWRSFPDDHLVTLTSLCDHVKGVDPYIVNLVTDLSNSELANQIILNYVIVIMKGDQQMKGFCDLMENLINNPAMSKIVNALRIGIVIL